MIKTSEHTSLIKEPGKREVTIRNSNLAKFVTKAERQSDLKWYADRRPKVPTGKITEDLINQPNVSRALRVRMPTKPKKTIVPAPPQPPTELVTDFAPRLVLPQTSIVIAEPPTPPKRKAATKATEALQPTKKNVNARHYL